MKSEKLKKLFDIQTDKWRYWISHQVHRKHFTHTRAPDGCFVHLLIVFYGVFVSDFQFPTYLCNFK